MVRNVRKWRFMSMNEQDEKLHKEMVEWVADDLVPYRKTMSRHLEAVFEYIQMSERPNILTLDDLREYEILFQKPPQFKSLEEKQEYGRQVEYLSRKLLDTGWSPTKPTRFVYSHDNPTPLPGLPDAPPLFMRFALGDSEKNKENISRAQELMRSPISQTPRGQSNISNLLTETFFRPDEKNIEYLRKQYREYQTSHKQCQAALEAAKHGESEYRKIMANKPTEQPRHVSPPTEPEVDLSEWEEE